LSKKTKLLVLIPCAIYLLLFVLTLIFPVSGMGSISLSNGENILVALVIIVSIGFWGALLSGLYRMYREATVLDKLDK